MAWTKEAQELWHHRFGHLGEDGLTQLRTGEMVSGLSSEAAAKPLCEGCVVGKQTRNVAHTPLLWTKRPVSEVLQLVHTDICGPLQVPSRGGARYFVTLLDDHSSLVAVQLLKRKSDAPEAIRSMVTLLENQSGHAVRAMRSDRGGEYIGHELEGFLRQRGINHEMSAPTARSRTARQSA